MGRALFVALVSAATLAYEVQLLRLLGIQHWHSFAGLIIGVALLGYAAAGTGLALAELRGFAARAGHPARAAAALAIAMPLAAALAQRLPFNGLELIWNPVQAAWLAALFVLLALPFAGAGLAIVLAFRLGGTEIHRLYAGDLAGAAVGAAASAWLLVHLPPAVAIGAPALVACAACLVVNGLRRPIPALAGAIVAIGALVLGEPGLRITPYKGLPQALQVAGAELAIERFTRHGYLTAVENARIPLRFAPGMSLVAGAEPPAQVAVFVDGDDLSAIDAAAGHIPHLTETVAGAVYRGMPPDARVLLAGIGTGAELRRALDLGAGRILAVDHHPGRIRLLQKDYAAFAGRPLDDARVELRLTDPRRVLAAAGGHFDLVVLAADASLAASSAGVGSLAAGYQLTREAWTDALSALGPGGLVAWTGWVDLPPRRVPKVLNTVRDALETRGVRRPADHVMVLRDWSVASVMVSAEPLGPERIGALTRFAERGQFDLVCHPGMGRDRANRRHRWRAPMLHDACSALLGAAPERDRFVDRYRFDLDPVTDDRPYPGHTFRPGLLAELGRGRNTAVLLESGYLTQAATVAAALVMALALLGLPWWALRRRSRGPPARAAAYFTLIGLGFLMIEISAIERAALWLGHAAEAFALVVAAMLLGAGIGSMLSERLARRFGRRRLLALAAAWIGLTLLAATAVAPTLDRLMLTLPLPAVAGGAVALLGLPALAMGLFFPLGLSAIGRRAPAALPWCWAANGASSVVAAAVAPLIAADFGLSVLMLLGLASYPLAVACAGEWVRSGDGGE